MATQEKVTISLPKELVNTLREVIPDRKKRPALILSNNIHNQYSPLVTVAPLSSNTNKIYPFIVYVPKKSANIFLYRALQLATFFFFSSLYTND